MWVSTLARASSRIENARLANDGAGDGRTLLLASGEGKPALADHGLVLLGKALDILRNAGDLGGALHLFVGCVFYAEGNVFADRCAEQEGFLGNESDLAAQGFQRILADRASVDQHRSGRGVE